jgi:hypothetical protein
METDNSTENPMATTTIPGRVELRKEEELVLLLVRQLAEAQFVRADEAASRRLWSEVAQLGFEPERVIQLLYSGHDPGDREGLRRLDRAFMARRQAERQGGRRPLRWPWAGGAANGPAGRSRHRVPSGARARD